MSAPQSYVIPAAANKEAVLDAFARSLGFPSYFGHNLDALADCLRDFAQALTGPTVVRWEVDPAFRQTRAFAHIQQILAGVTEASPRRLSVVLA
ncbi:barstar family protein [Psychromicrobium xiongbiense]|uniref:barstar family protein n=1 Tax=Psychromicrobium xiongbiense TaxID=3051184 RepID=UPI002557AAE6|nr:barstar family protein [Psychromicrobium sp. YIM S02556]